MPCYAGAVEFLPKDFYYKSNRLQQLRGFYYTVQLGSVSKAAERMGLQQSTVTMQIQSLERDLGVTLFRRKGQGIVPTEKGELLYSLSLAHIEGIDSLYALFYSENAKRKHQFLTIAANHTTVLHMLPAPVCMYKRRHPQVTVTIKNIVREESYQLLLEDQVHLVAGPVRVHSLPKEFEFIHVRTEDVVLVTRTGHPLLKEKNLTLGKIAEYELIRMWPSPYSTIEMFLEIVKTYRWETNLLLQDSDWEINKHFVREGDGFTIVSRLAYDARRDIGLEAISVPQFFPDVQYGLVMKKGKHPLPHVRDFIRIIAPKSRYI